MPDVTEKVSRRLYYVSNYTEHVSQSEMFRPACITKIGVASGRHIYNDSEPLDAPNGDFCVDVYPDLVSAWDACKRRATLLTIVLDDNMSDDDRRYIADDINTHPDMMEYHYSGNGKSRYTIKTAYVRHHEMKAMCDANRLPVDFKLARSTALSEKYSESYAKNDRDGNMRDSVFDKQAEYQRSMGLRFSSDFINEVTDVFITDQDADQKMDAYFKAIADVYNMDFVSISDIDMSDLKESPEGALFTEVTYNGKIYIVTIDESRRESYQRQAADSILRQVREAAAASISADKSAESKAESKIDAVADNHDEVSQNADDKSVDDKEQVVHDTDSEIHDVAVNQPSSARNEHVTDNEPKKQTVREIIEIDMPFEDQDADFAL